MFNLKNKKFKIIFIVSLVFTLIIFTGKISLAASYVPTLSISDQFLDFIKNFFQIMKDAFINGVEGFKKLIDFLINEGIIKSIVDILKLTIETIVDLLKRLFN